MTLVTAPSATPLIANAIRNAADKTGADFDYLWDTAMRESSLNPQAKSKSSSAAGLFQFIDQTWLGMVKQHGHEIGLGEFAENIETTKSGRNYVADGQKRSEILALRHDPKISSFFAGKLTQESKSILEAELGRPATEEDLYLAHFFGPSTAAAFLKLNSTAPDTSASLHFAKEASANQSIFYNADGTAKSVREVYDRLTTHLRGTLAPEAAPAEETQTAALDPDQNTSLPPSLAPSLAPRDFHYTLFSSTTATTPPPLRASFAPGFLISSGILNTLTELRMPEMARKADSPLRPGQDDLHREGEKLIDFSDAVALRKRA